MTASSRSSKLDVGFAPLVVSEDNVKTFGTWIAREFREVLLAALVVHYLEPLVPVWWRVGNVATASD